MKTLILVLAIVTVFAACNKKSNPTDTEPEPQMSTTQEVDSVSFTLAITKPFFAVNDTLAASLTIQNHAQTQRAFTYGYTPQLFWSFWKDTSLIMSQPHVLFDMVTTTTFNPGESKVYSISQAIRNESGAPVVPGAYTLNANFRGSTVLLQLPVTLK